MPGLVASFSGASGPGSPRASAKLVRNRCALLLGLALAVACRPEGSSSGPSELVAPYPEGAWRRQTDEELSRILLWVSHVLVRHRDVRSRSVSFCIAGWSSMPEPPQRSRSEALELAHRIAVEAFSGSAEFAALARERSDDITTRERGGSLGGVAARSLARWPQVLDALTALEPGATSNVVETPYGFHVFQRRLPPPRARVSGVHIVIGHEQAEFLQDISGGAAPKRSRDAGLALARSVRAQAAADASRFGELVARHSEHPDRAAGGDLGEWSTWEPTDFPSQLDVLRGLTVGEVSPVIETLFGWEILLRTPERPREIYAMTAIQIPELERAREVAEVLRHDPGRFSELQEQHCCRGVVECPEGRGFLPLTLVLKDLRIGEIAVAPVDLGVTFVIPKRVVPLNQATAPIRFDLPKTAEEGSHATE